MLCVISDSASNVVLSRENTRLTLPELPHPLLGPLTELRLVLDSLCQLLEPEALGVVSLCRGHGCALELVDGGQARDDEQAGVQSLAVARARGQSEQVVSFFVLRCRWRSLNDGLCRMR